MSDYNCPKCNKPVSFGEAICPNCKADVTSLWEANAPKKDSPKVVPGMGGMSGGASPFPPAAGASPFPPAGGASPFPPAAGASPAASPFPPPAGGAPAASPFPPPLGGAPTASPFPPPAGGAPAASPFPPPAGGSAPFPPPAGVAATPAKPQSGPHLDIPQIGGKLYIDMAQSQIRIGRDEIQGCATKALPDLNAYKNISRVRPNSEHFILHVANGKVSIEDLHSTNGTYLGTTKLQGLGPQSLKEGDKIILPIEEFGKMVQLELFFKEK